MNGHLDDPEMYDQVNHGPTTNFGKFLLDNHGKNLGDIRPRRS